MALAFATMLLIPVRLSSKGVSPDTLYDVIEFLTHDGSTPIIGSFWLCAGWPLHIVMLIRLTRNWKVLLPVSKIWRLCVFVAATLTAITYYAVMYNSITHD